MLLRIASSAATLALVTGCSGGGIKPPSEPAPPVVRLVESPPCVTQLPPSPGPILLGIPSGETELTDEQEDALWALVEALEGYGWRAYRNCGPKEPTK